MHKLNYQPQDVREALVFAEAHFRAIGMPEMSPLAFVQAAAVDGEVLAAVYPLTKLRVQEVVPGLRLRNGSSIIDVTKVFPTNKEVVYKTNKGGLFRIPTEKFVQLARQQGYRKVWDVKSFLNSLRDLLKPVMDTVPLMFVMKWVLNAVRGKRRERDDHPTKTDKLEKGHKR